MSFFCRYDPPQHAQNRRAVETPPVTSLSSAAPALSITAGISTNTAGPLYINNTTTFTNRYYEENVKNGTQPQNGMLHGSSNMYTKTSSVRVERENCSHHPNEHPWNSSNIDSNIEHTKGSNSSSNAFDPAQIPRSSHDVQMMPIVMHGRSIPNRGDVQMMSNKSRVPNGNNSQRVPCANSMQMMHNANGVQSRPNAIVQLMPGANCENAMLISNGIQWVPNTHVKQSMYNSNNGHSETLRFADAARQNEPNRKAQNYDQIQDQISKDPALLANTVDNSNPSRNEEQSAIDNGGASYRHLPAHHLLGTIPSSDTEARPLLARSLEVWSFGIRGHRAGATSKVNIRPHILHVSNQREHLHPGYRATGVAHKDNIRGDGPVQQMSTNESLGIAPHLPPMPPLIHCINGQIPQNIPSLPIHSTGPPEHPVSRPSPENPSTNNPLHTSQTQGRHLGMPHYVARPSQTNSIGRKRKMESHGGLNDQANDTTRNGNLEAHKSPLSSEKKPISLLVGLLKENDTDKVSTTTTTTTKRESHKKVYRQVKRQHGNEGVMNLNLNISPVVEEATQTHPPRTQPVNIGSQICKEILFKSLLAYHSMFKMKNGAK